MRGIDRHRIAKALTAARKPCDQHSFALCHRIAAAMPQADARAACGAGVEPALRVVYRLTDDARIDPLDAAADRCRHGDPRGPRAIERGEHAALRRRHLAELRE